LIKLLSNRPVGAPKAHTGFQVKPIQGLNRPPQFR
jgi:hypothetical protein